MKLRWDNPVCNLYQQKFYGEKFIKNEYFILIGGGGGECYFKIIKCEIMHSNYVESALRLYVIAWMD